MANNIQKHEESDNKPGKKAKAQIYESWAKFRTDSPFISFFARVIIGGLLLYLTIDLFPKAWANVLVFVIVFIWVVKEYRKEREKLSKWQYFFGLIFTVLVFGSLSLHLILSLESNSPSGVWIAVEHMSMKYEPNEYAKIDLRFINSSPDEPALSCKMRVRLNTSTDRNMQTNPLYAYDKTFVSTFVIPPKAKMQARIPEKYHFVTQYEFDSVKDGKLFVYLYGILTYKTRDNDSCYFSFIARFDDVNTQTFSYSDSKYNDTDCFGD